MDQYFRAAIENVYKYGDTDIFPFPFENRAFYDEIDATTALLTAAFSDFEEVFAQNPPSDIRSLIPVNHTGFRWGSQLDPFWNLYFLGCVLSIAEKIEDCRVSEAHVFSYRLDKATYKSGVLFRQDINWRDFIQRSIETSSEYQYVISCDVADCYGRISHHKIENCLKLIGANSSIQKSVLKYLSYLTETRSAGVPVGGPAARIVAELALNNVDRMLLGRDLKFLRYADDYHIFVNSRREAYDCLFFLSEALDNEGLGLQKSKTRILSSAEYRSISNSIFGDENSELSPIQKLLTLDLRFDPYSPNAVEKYEELKGELDKIDIIGILNDQLSQSRIHLATARKVVSAIRAIPKAQVFLAIISILDNIDNLFPISSNILISILSVFDDLEDSEKDAISQRIREFYQNGHEIMGIETYLTFAVRIIGRRKSIENHQWLVKVFDDKASPLIRRDIIIIFSNWQEFQWLSVFRRRFETATPWERRAFIAASYSMSDEGRHWRDHSKRRYNEVEQLVVKWRSGRVQKSPEIPL